MENVTSNTKDTLREITYAEYDEFLRQLAEKIRNSGRKFYSIYPIPRGGYYPAIKLSQLLNIPLVTTLCDKQEESVLVVDDIVDSGRTIARYKEWATASVFYNPQSQTTPTYYACEKGDRFIAFPDEKQGSIDEQIRRILQYIGENPDRQGLVETPDRVIRMWREIFRGYHEENKPKITTFDNGADGLVYDNMVVDSGDFYSLCEHHIMPFFGKYWFAYVPHPKGKILGISKIGRVVDYCSARLQVQERLVRDVVDMLMDALGTDYPPLGMALVMKGEHLCKSMRGVKKKGTMTSSYLVGMFKSDTSMRAEFMNLINNTQ